MDIHSITKTPAKTSIATILTSVPVSLGMVFALSMNSAAFAQADNGFHKHVMTMAKDREKLEDMQWN